MYDYKKSIVKGLRVFVIFALPVLADKFIISYPEIFQLTIGGLLIMGVNYLKQKLGVTLGGIL